MKTDIIITTSDNVPGREIEETYGLVRGNTVRAKNIGRDIGASFKNIFGGEVRSYTDLLRQSREEAILRMVEDAKKLGANAIVATRMTTASVMAGSSEILAYGTAVKLK